MIFTGNCTNKDGTEFTPSTEQGDVKTTLPGIGQYSSKLLDTLKATRTKRTASYKPRTRHLDESGWAKYTNRLFLESSPYLQQHAHNPVNWFPWGQEAFDKAKELNRPVLLSIGYSTCHWCHVMEEESFEDVEIAKTLNENYIAVKVDREERPDIDAIYMAVVQAISGGGGWPMTVWLNPDKKPIYGATYVPPRDGARGSRTGFLTMLKYFKNLYDTDPEKIAKSSDDLAKHVAKRLEHSQSSELANEDALHIAAEFYKKRFDKELGGLSGEPKFPSSLPNRLLLRYFRRSNNKDYLAMVEKTLTAMSSGGMYDQVAGGFHRYSTDSHWLVPHFEKMLYDNALLAQTYTEAYQLTANPEHKRVATEILDYVLKDMTDSGGAFYSATDADSIGPNGEREEGYFFTWTPQELAKILTANELSLVTAFYRVTPQGNFEGRTILSTNTPLATIAKKYKLTEDNARTLLNSAKDKLYNERKKRPLPIRDEKILSSWNGLMISAFAQASFVYKNKRYLNAAKKAAQFLMDHSLKNNRLHRSFKEGQAKHNAYLDDYAFLIAGLIELYEASGEVNWLSQAIALDKVLEAHYEDKKHGGYFMTSDDHEKLLAREKPAYDGAEPSGNSIQVMNLLKLHAFTTNDTYRQRAVATFKSFAHILKQSPYVLSEMLLAWDFYLDKAQEIVIVRSSTQAEELTPLEDVVRQQFAPNRILAVVSDGDDLLKQTKVLPLVKGKLTTNEQSTAYVCQKGVCKLPTRDPMVLKTQISVTNKYQFENSANKK